jgi:hypothetical protein
MMQAFGGKVYAYRADRRHIEVFPVTIDRQSYLITCGEPVNLADLGGDYATFDNKYLLGVRKVAGFSARQYQTHTPRPPRRDDPLQPLYEVLGVGLDANEAEIKRAYRRRAQQYHPDMNPAPDATEMMQRINLAYTEIMKRFE